MRKVELRMKEKNSKYCIIKTMSKEIRVRNSLKKLQEELHLAKYKKHILVNEYHIKEKNNKYIVFKDNSKLYFQKVARHKKTLHNCKV